MIKKKQDWKIEENPTGIRTSFEIDLRFECGDIETKKYKLRIVKYPKYDYKTEDSYHSYISKYNRKKEKTYIDDEFPFRNEFTIFEDSKGSYIHELEVEAEDFIMRAHDIKNKFGVEVPTLINNDEETILMHYVNINGKSKNIAKEYLKGYIQNIKESIPNENIKHTYIPVTEGITRIECIKVKKSNINTEEIMTKSKTLIDMFCANIAYDSCEEHGILTEQTDRMIKDLKEVKSKIEDINEYAYSKILKGNDDAGVPVGLINDSHVTLFYLDFENKKVACKNINKSLYYEYLALIEKQSENYNNNIENYI